MKCNRIVSRRDFIRTSSAVGAAAVLQANMPLLKAQDPAAGSKNAKTLVHLVFLAKPVPTWPFPGVNLQEEIRTVRSALAGLEKRMDRPVEIAGGELLRTADDVPAVREALLKADGVLAFNLTSTCGPMLNPIIDLGVPTVMFSQPYSGHDWSLIADLQRRGRQVEVVSSSDFNDLEPVFRMFDTIRRVKRDTVLCLRQNQEKNASETALESRYGLTLKPMGYSELNVSYGKVDSEKAAAMADAFIKTAAGMLEPVRRDVVDSMKLYLAIQELLAQNGSDVITIDCLGGFRRSDLPAYPCVSWVLLNDAGRIGVCEADVLSTVSQMLLQYLTGRPGFVSDPVIDTKTNTVIHAHCVSATKMDGPKGPAAPYIIRSHMEDGKGVSVQVKMRIGQPITLAKLVDPGTMVVSTGEITDTPDNKRGCRTKATTRVSNADRLLHNYTGGLHRVLVYGDCVREVRTLGRLMGFSVVDEA